jgi:hypothetical protein
MPLKWRNTLQEDRLQVINTTVIKQLILEGPAYSFITQQIDPAVDGRAAMEALRAHYEGGSFVARQKQVAYTVLEMAHYKRELATLFF